MMKQTYGWQAAVALLLLVSARVAVGGPAPVLHAYRGATPTLDGQLAAGEYDDAFRFDSSGGWTPQFYPTTDPADLAVVGYIKHDGEHLYVAVRVTDDVLYGIETPRWLPDENPNVHAATREGYPWFGDAMEILLNASAEWTDPNAFVRGTPDQWQMCCNLTKSLQGGVGRGGILPGEPRARQAAWDLYAQWIEQGAMTAVAAVLPDQSGYVMEWRIAANPCLPVGPGAHWSPARGVTRMGINIGVQDLDERERGAGNFGNFHHEDWWAGTRGHVCQVGHFGTLVLHPGPRPRDYVVAVDGDDRAAGTETDPFATLGRAQQAVRPAIAAGATGEIRVLIRGGRYELCEPLVFTPADGGHDELTITYAAWPGETPVFSGGSVIGNWRRGDGDRWVTDVPAVRDDGWCFRDLYVDGRRAVRARFPNADEPPLRLEEIGAYEPMALRQEYVVDRPVPGGNLAEADAEVVVTHFWSIARQGVKATEGRQIATNFPAGWTGHWLTSPVVGHDVFVEHALAFVDRPGEWYLDRERGQLTYQGAPHEDLTCVDVIAPRLGTLLKVEGTSAAPVRNIRFQGLTFAHAAWALPLFGYNGIQAGCYGQRYVEDPTYMLPAAVLLQHACDCRFESCRVRHTGASGLALGAGCRRNRVVGCELADIGGNALVNGWRPKADDPPRRWFENDWDDPADAPRGNVFEHNHLHHSGVVQWGTVGYFEAFAADSVFAHNLLHDMPYSGVSIGFRWARQPSTQRRSTVAYNEIHSVMQKLHDGGAVYTLGYQPGTRVTNNYIHDSDDHGLYADEASCPIVFENNVISRVAVHGFQQNHGTWNVVRNNLFYSCGNYALHRNQAMAQDPAFIVERNIFYVDRYEPPAFAWYRNPRQDGAGFLWENTPSDVFEMDHNLFWDARGREVKLSGRTLAEHQQQRGKDRHSVVADPILLHEHPDDYRLRVDSPARHRIGFEPINLSEVGPQGGYRTALDLPPAVPVYTTGVTPWGPLAWPSEPPQDCPFEPSEDIGGVGFTGVNLTYTNADTWYPTWAADGNLYSPWTDGWIQGAECWSMPLGDQPARTGQAMIVGDDPLHLQIVSLGTQPGDPAPYGGRYPCGSLVYRGVWYYGTYCLINQPPGYNWGTLGPLVGFRISYDMGRTWEDCPHTPAAPLLGESGLDGQVVKLGAPHFVDFGRDMEHSPDGKAYLVGHGARPDDPAPRPANLSWISGDEIYLARVTPTPAYINDAARYEFFAGHDAQGRAQWTNDLAASRPLVQWNNRCGCVTMTYNPGLDKYLMCITDGWPTIETMNTCLLEADRITGPWRLVSYLRDFGVQAYFVNIPSKFISADGRQAWLCYSGNFTHDQPVNPPGGRYGMCLQEIALPDVATWRAALAELP